MQFVPFTFSPHGDSTRQPCAGPSRATSSASGSAEGASARPRCGDPGFIASLARGRSLRLDTADRLLAFMGEAPIGPAFLCEIETFLSVTRTKAYLLGLDAAGDPSFVARLRNGVSPRLATIDRVRARMDEVCTDAQRRGDPRRDGRPPAERDAGHPPSSFE